MKPSLEQLRAACPEVDGRLVARHLDSLGDDYFEAFAAPEVARHLGALARLTPPRPVQVLIDRAERHQTGITVLAFDYPGEFSLIAGILAGTGLNILSGEIFTYRPAPAAAPAPEAPRPRRRRRAPGDPLLHRRLIIDHFAGHVRSEVALDDWETKVRSLLSVAVSLLETGGEAVGHARHLVNELVAARLVALRAESRRVFYPVEIELPDRPGPYTTLQIRSQDTPAFLYALSNALSLQGVSIERVRIRTAHGRIEDEIDILDARGGRIADRDRLDQIKLAVLLTKQFTYFLGGAPDPYAALSRFEQLASDVVQRPERGAWLDLFADQKALRDLARILGASDYLWEDFVRSQYETLLPIMRDRAAHGRLAFTREALRERLRAALEGAASLEDTRRRLNEWKDREIFLIDLDNILEAGVDVRALAEPLTRLAEVAVEASVRAVGASLAAAHGVPRTVGGLEARCAVFGLGKMGGVALGYASDIELLFVYSDSGRTDGADALDNAEFHERLAAETALFIEAKREGIFHVDLRLRPHGNSGPKACSLDSFCRYYGPGGPAHSYERLALTRLRAVAGDPALGAQVERLRDAFVYETRSIAMEELQSLREKQFAEKVKGDRYNAKFSPGALVDVEYFVQILQVQHGRDAPRLRTPRIHAALAALSDAGLLAPAESQPLTAAYYFLRRLINGLRLLRGNAVDLCLPAPDEDEYAHLARRMGYERSSDLEAEKRLFVDFETHTAVVRAFIARHFGRASLSGPPRGNVADLVLTAHPPPDLREAVLRRVGFGHVDRAYHNLRRLAARQGAGGDFARLAVLACDMMQRGPAPDMALNNWERFVDALPDPAQHYALLLAQPRRLEILLGLMAASQFLADTLVHNAEFFDWVTDPAILHGARHRARIEADLDAYAAGADGHAEWLDALRRFRRRETLRIGTRDICLRAPVAEVAADLSALAEALADAALRREWRELEAGGAAGAGAAEARYCILALGKLGGAELNYSSDIDLLAVYEQPEGEGGDAEAERALFVKVTERLRAALSNHTAEGYAFRVDFRLRPHGRAGALAQSAEAMLRYDGEHAALWELQALLKARPVAGALDVGRRFLLRLRPVLQRRRSLAEIAGSIARMRARAVGHAGAGVERDVKTGLGGIRDVEFLVQGLQLLHLPDHAALFEGHTLRAIGLLRRLGLLADATAATLEADYLFLRRVEHFLQLFEDRQVHELPADEAALKALGRRVLGEGAGAEEFMRQVRAAQERVQSAFQARIGAVAADRPTDARTPGP